MNLGLLNGQMIHKRATLGPGAPTSPRDLETLDAFMKRYYIPPLAEGFKSYLTRQRITTTADLFNEESAIKAVGGSSFSSSSSSSSENKWLPLKTTLTRAKLLYALGMERLLEVSAMPPFAIRDIIIECH